MKTITTISAMPSPNVFKIANVEDYNLIEVTASEGEHKVSMSFPWAHSIPYMNADVQDAVKKCIDTTQANLLYYLERNRKNETPVDKVLRFLRREIQHLMAMTKL